MKYNPFEAANSAAKLNASTAVRQGKYYTVAISAISRLASSLNP
jgi:hypothetical protein